MFFSLMRFEQIEQTKSANVCLHLLPPISDHGTVHLGDNSFAIFTHR